MTSKDGEVSMIVHVKRYKGRKRRGLLKGLLWRWDSGLLEDLNCPISPTYSYPILLPKMLYAINYSGIKFYTCIGYEVTMITQIGFLPLVVV